MSMRKMSKKTLIVTVLIALLCLTLAAICVLNFLDKSNNKTYEEKVADFKEENPKLEKGQIVFVGDSITEGYNLKRYYRDLDLKAYNRGISGDSTQWLISRLHESVIEIAPSKIVLMIGTNDVNTDVPEADVLKNYRGVLETISITLPDAELYGVSIIPQNTNGYEDAMEKNERIQRINAEIKKIVSEFGYEYVNIYDSLTDENGLLDEKYTPDGIHLDRHGYKGWTKIMKEFLD